MVLFCINLDGGFVEFSDFVAWLIPTKVCGTIGYEVTFLPLEVFTLPLKKWDGNIILPMWAVQPVKLCKKGAVLCAERVLVSVAASMASVAV